MLKNQNLRQPNSREIPLLLQKRQMSMIDWLDGKPKFSKVSGCIIVKLCLEIEAIAVEETQRGVKELTLKPAITERPRSD